MKYYRNVVFANDIIIQLYIYASLASWQIVLITHLTVSYFEIVSFNLNLINVYSNNTLLYFQLHTHIKREIEIMQFNQF